MGIEVTAWDRETKTEVDRIYYPGTYGRWLNRIFDQMHKPGGWQDIVWPEWTGEGRGANEDVLDVTASLRGFFQQERAELRDSVARTVQDLYTRPTTPGKEFEIFAPRSFSPVLMNPGCFQTFEEAETHIDALVNVLSTRGSSDQVPALAVREVAVADRREVFIVHAERVIVFLDHVLSAVDPVLQFKFTLSDADSVPPRTATVPEPSIPFQLHGMTRIPGGYSVLFGTDDRPPIRLV